MKRLALVVVVLLSLTGLAHVSSAGGVPSNAASDPAPLNKMPKDLEERFALSALPPHLRAGATVFLLDPATGYVLDRKGTNGFSCIVERTEQERADFRNDVYAAICFDAEGSEKILPVWMDVARMRAEGKLSPMEVKEEVAQRYANGTYRPPSRMGISFMIAPLMRSYPAPDARNHEVMTMNMPHYMFYATHVTDADIGAGQFNSQYPFVLNAGGQDYIIMLIGDREREEINRESVQLVKDLCVYSTSLCNPAHLHPKT
jgi:hypothetical protein